MKKRKAVGCDECGTSGGMEMSWRDSSDTFDFLFSDQGTARTALGALGKMFAEAAFTTMFLYTTELYPTVMRSEKTMFCLCLTKQAMKKLK